MMEISLHGIMETLTNTLTDCGFSRRIGDYFRSKFCHNLSKLHEV